MVAPKLDIPHDRLADFAKRWKINRIELFGSALRDDFRMDSDLDLLISFEPDSDWTLFEFFRLEEQLTEIIGRRVDVVTRRSVERSGNGIRREAILGSARTIYEA